MPGVQKVRSKVNVVMNRLVGEGIITGFKTNFGDGNETTSQHVTVSAPEGRTLDDVRALVVDAVADTAIGISVTVERVST